MSTALASPEPLVVATAGPDARRRAGWRIVAGKELAGYVRSVRFVILLVLVSLAGLASVHSASGPIRTAAANASQVPSVFLYLFTLSPDRVPAFHEFIGILGPLLGIAFGFDAICGERARRTLPRLVSQPIHRDDLIVGKFVAGLAAIALVIGAMTAMVAGYGMLRLGVAPDLAAMARIVAFVAVTLVYVGVWLALAIFLSVVVKRSATAALASIAVWLVLTLFFGLIAGVVADTFRSVPRQATIEQELANARLEQTVRRFSPDELYKEATSVLLDPAQQTTGIVVVSDADQNLPSSLSLDQSMLLAWWQVVAMAATVVVLFAAAFVLFMRQEVRA